MVKKVLLISFCFVVGIFFTTASFSQDDPATTEGEETATEETAGGETAAGETAQQGPDAKTYYNGENTFVNATVQFKLQAKDNVSLEKILYRIDNGDIQEYSSPFSITTEGSHSISYYGIDKIGNQEDAKVYSVVVDTSAPVINIRASAPVVKANGKVYVSKDFTFTIQAKDKLSGVNKVEYTLNGESREYSAPFSISTEGEFELKAKAIDNVNNTVEQYNIKVVDENGNEETLENATAKLAVDNTAPTVQITPSEALKKSESNRNIAPINVKYSITAADNDSGIASILYRIDGQGDYKNYINEIKFKTNGEHTIEAKSIDRVGNTSTIETISVFVDVIPPATRLETVPE